VSADLARRVSGHPGWYHVLELPGGVVTAGFADLRDVAATALPDALGGLRCLDVGTFDGFWAFEMERRGAAEVLAFDLPDYWEADLPPATRARLVREGTRLPWGAGFALAREALRSTVRRVEGTVYELGVAALGGPVDIALCGTLLQHLRDPVGALERIRSVLAPDGHLLVVEVYLHRASRRRPLAEFRPMRPGSHYTWWVPNLEALEDWLRTAGFGAIEHLALRRLPGAGRRFPDRLAILRARA
jgi:SAM-dependent methyltransferase